MPASAQLGVQVSYLAGGGAAFAPVKLRSLVQPRAVSVPGYEEFALANGAVREGLQADRRCGLVPRRIPAVGRGDRGTCRRGAGSADQAAEDAQLRSGRGRRRQGHAGRACRSRPTRRRSSPSSSTPTPTARCSTTSTRIPLWPAALIVGLKPDSWALSQDKVKFQAVALDLTGKPVAGARVSVDLFERKTFSHRKRLLGGFYAYQSGAEVKRLQQRLRGAHRRQGAAVLRVRLAGVRRAAGGGACGGRRRQRRGGQHQRVGGRQGRVVVRRVQRRPHGRAARAQALRARRDGGVPGAHAVSRGHRAGHGGARRRDGRAGRAAVRQGAGGEGPGARQLCAQRLRVGAGRARTGGGRAAHGAGGPGQAGVQDGRGADRRRLARARAEGERQHRPPGLSGARQGEGERGGEARAGRQAAAARARRWPWWRWTRACWS